MRTNHPPIEASNFLPQNSILVKNKVAYFDNYTPKMHWTQPYLKLGTEIPIYSGNPATDSSKLAIFGNKAASSSKVKLLDLISRHQKYIGPDHNFSSGLLLINFQKKSATHPSRQVVSGHKIEFSSKAKLFTLISRHQKYIGPNYILSWGLRYLYI